MLCLCIFLTQCKGIAAAIFGKEQANNIEIVHSDYADAAPLLANRSIDIALTWPGSAYPSVGSGVVVVGSP